MTQRIFSGAPWEPRVGYCRAIRRGSMIAVTGTTAVGADGEIVGIGDPYAQTVRCLEIIAAALDGLGATMADVIRTRIYVTNIDQWEAVGDAHREQFGAHPPATTMVEVARLIDPRLLVEIEADAIVGDPD